MTGASGHVFWDISLGIQLEANSFWLLAAIIFCMPVTNFVKAQLEKYLSSVQLQYASFAHALINVGLMLTSVGFLVGKSYNPFLYFRF
jgi:alginate O-acetyltransferase complex protein AlgI